MSLSDLIELAPAQNKVISNLSSGIDSETQECVCWKGFRDSLWGKDLQSPQDGEALGSFQKRVPLERGVDPVRDIHPPEDYVVANIPGSISNVWGLTSQQILVRSEYGEAEQAVVSASKTSLDAFVVSGRPGIGLLASLSTAYRI